MSETQQEAIARIYGPVDDLKREYDGLREFRRKVRRYGSPLRLAEIDAEAKALRKRLLRMQRVANKEMREWEESQ